MESPGEFCHSRRLMNFSFPMSLSSPRNSRPLLALALLVAAGLPLSGPSYAGSTDAPTPAPGEMVPLHAAGGWPSSTTGDDKKPARTPEQQAQLDAVTNELKRLANEYGPDSVVLQAKLLIRSMASGALGASEVKVAGPSTVAGDGYLELDVETGLYFDGRTTTPESRRDEVWKSVALPVLDQMVTFKIEPGSLEMVLLYDVQDLEPGTSLDPSAPARHEGFRVQLPRELLAQMIDDQVVGEAVQQKAKMTQPVPTERATAARPADAQPADAAKAAAPEAK